MMKEYTNAFLTENAAALAQLSARLLCALVYIALGFAAAKLVKLILRKIIKNRRSVSARKAKTITLVAYSFMKYLICFLVVCQVFSIFGVNMGSLLALAGIGSVAIGFGAQSLVRDVITGLFILMEDQFGVGDVVTVGGRSGTVESVGIRTTTLRSAEGDVHIIPNGQIDVVTNTSRDYNRAAVDIRIPYEADMERVLHIFEDEAQNMGKALTGLISAPAVLGIVSFTESAVVIRVLADCAVGENFRVEREMRRRLKIRLDKEGIAVPYPKHTVGMLKDGAENGN